MNREDTKKAIAVMQAYVDGKEIETRWHSKYESCCNPAWHWDDAAMNYRVKPEPRVIEVREGETLVHYKMLKYGEREVEVFYGPCKFIEVIE